MSDLDQLLEAFARGDLVRPSSDHMGFVDVVRAVAHASGVKVPLNEHSRDLGAHLQGVDHLIFLMADGLGINLIDLAPRNSWLREHTRRAILAPFPSTTTTAVTSFFTGEHAATHSVIGWWVHIPEMNSTATVFQHDRATDGKALGELGIGVPHICACPPLLPRMGRQVAMVAPESIIDSPYTSHMAEGCERIGYRGHADAIAGILRFIQQSTGPTFTYWYTPSPDSEAHDAGAEDERVLRAVARLDEAGRQISTALNELSGTWRIVGTADHGHLNLEPRLEILEDDDLLQYLVSPPAGDMRVQYWHVRAEQRDAFCEAFRVRFGPDFFLLLAEDVEELRLFGDEAWSETTRRRAGTHISISRGASALRYAGIPGAASYRKMRSGHSGLSPVEMRIPLIIAGEETRAEDYGI